MKSKDSQYLNQNTNDVIKFNINSDFLANFPRKFKRESLLTNPSICPQFSPENRHQTQFIESTPELSRPSSLMNLFCQSVLPENKTKYDPPVTSNPFNVLSFPEEKKDLSLGGFLPDLNVSRISEKYPTSNYCSISKTNNEIIRSMDFETISFEQNNTNQILQTNNFFDLQSIRQESPIQKSSNDHQNDLQMLLKNRNQKYFDYHKNNKLNPKPIYSLSPEMSKSVGPTFENIKNPFQDISYTSEQRIMDRNHGSFKWPGLCSNSQKKNYSPGFSMNKSLIQKNCFYETDEESEKETIILSKDKSLPMNLKYQKLKKKKLFFHQLKKKTELVNKLIPETSGFLSRNDSFLTHNKSMRSIDRSQTGFGAFPIYNAGEAVKFKQTETRSQSQRSIFSLNIGRKKQNIFHAEKKNYGQIIKNNSCIISRRKKSHHSSFLLNNSKSSNFLDNFLKNEIDKKSLTPKKIEQKRAFSPSQHSIKKNKFWPNHLEERFSALNTSFLSGLDVSCLSSNINEKEKCKKKNIEIGNKIVQLNQKMKEKLLKRNNEFDPEQGKKLVSLFTELLANAGEDFRGYKDNIFLKKIKKN